MLKAFVFGKFLPFHKGHEAMICFALTKCDSLTVLVCCSDKEQVNAQQRCSWISETFQENARVEVKAFCYLENDLPNTSKSSETISKTWAKVFKKLLPDCSLLITSEPYGDFVAKYMDIRHLVFDPERRQFKVSASIIKGDLFSYWNFLPESVKKDYAIKVVILGTESTGKTVLTKKLSGFYHCTHVSEAGRELISNSNSFDYEDLKKVAEVHAGLIQHASMQDSPLVIIDTDIHTTLSYSRFMFKRDLEISNEIYQINKSHLYLYLNNDVEFIQDGTRLDEADRNRLDLSHRLILAEHGIEFVEIRGDWESRYQQAVKLINQLIDSKKKIE